MAVELAPGASVVLADDPGMPPGRVMPPGTRACPGYNDDQHGELEALPLTAEAPEDGMIAVTWASGATDWEHVEALTRWTPMS